MFAGDLAMKHQCAVMYSIHTRMRPFCCLRFFTIMLAVGKDENGRWIKVSEYFE